MSNRSAEAHAQTVQTFLSRAQIKDAGSSRVSLHEEYERMNFEDTFIGYRANIDFRVIHNDLSRLEEILTGLVDAGAKKLGVSFQTTRLKELRAEVRRQAIIAAREKAENYCVAAGVELGEVIHIEDSNPNQLWGGEGHVRMEDPMEDSSAAQAFAPGNIMVSGAVRVAYKIRGGTS